MIFAQCYINFDLSSRDSIMLFHNYGLLRTDQFLVSNARII